MTRRPSSIAEAAGGRRRNPAWREPHRAGARLLAHAGDSWLWLAALGLLSWRGGATWQPLARSGLLAVVSVSLLTAVIKIVVRRPRPEGAPGGVAVRLDPHAFPSGHAARIAAVAAVGLVGAQPTTATFLLVLAVSVSAARVSLRLHDLLDVLGGGLLGLLVGAAVGLAG